MLKLSGKALTMTAVYKLVLTFFVWCALTVVSAQPLTVKYLGIQQGLSNNSLSSIYQDHNGFMWFGTYDGLSRYDGYSFQVFRNIIDDTTSLLSNTIYTVNGDSQHNLWVGGQKGACVFHPATATFSPLRVQLIGKPVQLLQDIVHQIIPIKSGAMLVGSQSLGLVLFESYTKTGHQIPLPFAGRSLLNYDAFSTAYKVGDDYCWIFVRQVGLCRFTVATQQLQVMDANLRAVDCMSVDRDGKLWIGNGDGLFLYNEQQKQLSHNYLSIPTKVTNILQDSTGTIWIGTDGEGLFTLLKNAEKAYPFMLANGSSPVKSNSVWPVYEDVNGCKWIGTLRGGISMLDFSPKLFKHVVYHPENTKQSPEQNFILSFAEDERQNVWIGTDGGGLRYWDRWKNVFTDYTHKASDPSSLSSNFITSIIIDSLHDVWTATWFGGVSRISKGKIERFTCYNPIAGHYENNIWLVYEDKQKTIWASATNTGCLYRFDRKANVFQLFDSHINDLQSITETSDGQLWAGNYTDLICIDRINKKHLVYKIDYPVRSILEDRQHRLWLGTQEGGMLLFDRKTGKTTRYSTANGLPSNTILRMLEDKKGHIWLSTNNGLSCFNPVENKFRNFSVSDGLQSSEFGYNASLSLRSGEFLFGGINGFNIFFPDSIASKQQAPNILLTGVSINNTPVEKDSQYVTSRQAEIIKSIRLPYHEATLSLDFLSLDYIGAANIEYAYYLEGWDKKWNNGTARKANFSRLHEGTYVFKVKATGNNGEWSQPITLLTITVLPPWYRTWWAYLLYALCVIGAVYLYILYTRKQERLRFEVKLAQVEKEKEKELAEQQLSMFTYISHEFRTPLSLIIDPLKKIIGQRNKDGGQFGNELSTAHRNARRLLSLVNQLLLFRKADSGADILHPSQFDVVALCNEVFQSFSHQAKDKNIEFLFHHEVATINFYGDHEKLEIALFNLVSNAFKFTPKGGSIQIAVFENADQVSISVSDTGCGIAKEDVDLIFGKFQQGGTQQKKSGFGIGLYLVKHFVEKHHGHVTCSSEEGKGATFTLSLPKAINNQLEPQAYKTPIIKSELMEELLEYEPEEETVPSSKAIVPISAEDVVTEKRSILVIDDNDDIRQYLLNLFAKDYLTYSSDNAEDGYRLAEKYNPDLIISDIAMAGNMDGVELCHKIKQSEQLSHIPVILLTAATNNETKLQGISEGADDYITKPFDSDLLLARVQGLLKNQTQLRKYFLDSITLKEHNQKVPSEYHEFLKRCIEIIEANLENADFNSQTFARAMGMSHSALYTKIKAVSGQTLTAFVRSIRMRRAAVLMLTENMNVTQASFQVGFENVRYFREQFTKLFGITPSEYIKKYRHSFNKDLNTMK